MKAKFDEVKTIADKSHTHLLGVDLLLPEKSDLPLIYDSMTFSASTGPIPGGQPLSRLDDLLFVAMEAWIIAWKVAGKPNY